jgi:hypothetical protein
MLMSLTFSFWQVLRIWYAWFSLGLEHERAFKFEEINTDLPPRLLTSAPSMSKEEREKMSVINSDSAYSTNLAPGKMNNFFSTPPSIRSILFPAK